jgi:hypothetical protein
LNSVKVTRKAKKQYQKKRGRKRRNANDNHGGSEETGDTKENRESQIDGKAKQARNRKRASDKR